METDTPPHDRPRANEPHDEDPLAGTLELFSSGAPDALPGGRVRATLTLSGHDPLPIEFCASSTGKDHGYTARLVPDGEPVEIEWRACLPARGVVECGDRVVSVRVELGAHVAGRTPTLWLGRAVLLGVGGQ